MTNINNPSSSGSDLFGMDIIYQGGSNTSHYNGNISAIKWRVKSENSVRQYDYSYDNLNRLTAANYIESSPIFRTSNDYNTSYSYDLNGNITTLTRNGFNGSGHTQIDNLNYSYANDGALTSLTENSNKTHGFKSALSGNTGGYTYDGNGNMLTDAHKDIIVTYNFLNLPTKVTKGSDNIEWVYDAAGTKLSKASTGGANANHLSLNNTIIANGEHKASQTITSNGTVPSAGDVTFTAGECITLHAGFEVSGNSDFLARILGNTESHIRDYCGGFEYDDRGLVAIYFMDGRVAYEGNNATYQYVLNDYQGNVRTLFKTQEITRHKALKIIRIIPMELHTAKLQI